MKDEIKEIDITKDLYLCSPLLNTECSKENCYINNGSCCHTVIKEHSQQHLLDYITNLQEENQRYKKIFEAKERFSKVMPEDTDFIILSKADYDSQQEDIELTAIELKTRNEKAVEYIMEHLIPKNVDWDFDEVIFSDLPVERIKPILEILQGKSDE